MMHGSYIKSNTNMHITVTIVEAGSASDGVVWLVSGEGGWYLEASGGAGLSRLLAVETTAHRALGGDMGHTLPTSSCSM